MLKTSKAFKTLQNKWYKKLKAKGFKDIETNNDYESLKTWDAHWFASRQPSNLYFFSKQEYFYLAEHFLNSHTFKNKTEKKTWAFHVQGLSLREIQKEVEIDWTTIGKTIVVLKAIMLDEIQIRPFRVEDKAFIMATWLKGQYYGHPWFSEIKKDVYNQQYAAYVEQLLAKSNTKVNIACLRQDPEVILGYSVLSPTALHWCYVKDAWRRRGIAGRLTQGEAIVSVTSLTKPGKEIAKKRGWIFNPWAM